MGGLDRILRSIGLGHSHKLLCKVEILLYDISKGMAAKLGPLLLGKSAEAASALQFSSLSLSFTFYQAHMLYHPDRRSTLVSWFTAASTGTVWMPRSRASEHISRLTSEGNPATCGTGVEAC